MTDTTKDSFAIVKENMKVALNEMQAAMRTCSDYLQSTTQMDAVDSFANLAKAYTMMNKSLLDFEERERKEKQSSAQSTLDSTVSQTNNVIYASTSEMQQALRLVKDNTSANTK